MPRELLTPCQQNAPPDEWDRRAALDTIAELRAEVDRLNQILTSMSHRAGVYGNTMQEAAAAMADYDADRRARHARMRDGKRQRTGDGNSHPESVVTFMTRTDRGRVAYPKSEAGDDNVTSLLRSHPKEAA